MGAGHFRQMYADALAIDCRALPNALLLQMPLKVEHGSTLGDNWQGIPSDKLMDLARKLAPLDVEFSERLKLMLLSGDIVAYMHDQHGRLHKVRDPDVISFDDAILTKEGLYKLTEVYLSGAMVNAGENN